MQTRTNRTEEKKSQSAANQISQFYQSSNSSFQFVDNRPSAKTQKQLQRVLNNDALTGQLMASSNHFSSVLQAAGAPWMSFAGPEPSLHNTAQMKRLFAENDGPAISGMNHRQTFPAIQLQRAGGRAIRQAQPTPAQRKKAIQLMESAQLAVEGKISWADASVGWADAAKNYSPGDWSAVQRVAMDRYLSRASKHPANAGVAQLAEKSTWDKISDAITLGSLIATATSVIAQAASASGIGWFIPIALGAIGTFVPTMLETWGYTSEDDREDSEKRKSKTISEIIKFIGLLATGLVTVLANSDSVTFKAVTTTITLVLMLIMEFLRVKFLDRETIYGWVHKGLVEKCKKPEEQNSLL